MGSLGMGPDGPPSLSAGGGAGSPHRPGPGPPGHRRPRPGKSDDGRGGARASAPPGCRASAGSCCSPAAACRKPCATSAPCWPRCRTKLPPTTVLAPIGSTPSQPGAGSSLPPPRIRAHRASPPRSQAAIAWRRGALILLVGPGRFATWAPWAELGLATAGTATEQLVGLGIPALSLPGRGPQFKAGFARRQSRLLGGAVQPCHSSGGTHGAFAGVAGGCRRAAAPGPDRPPPHGALRWQRADRGPGGGPSARRLPGGWRICGGDDDATTAPLDADVGNF